MEDESLLQEVDTKEHILKISEVYSEAESKVKTEKPEGSVVNVIRVKTPGQLNGSVPKEPIPAVKQVLVKRLGNTSIRGPMKPLTATKVGEALKNELKAQMIKLPNGSHMVKLSNGAYSMVKTSPSSAPPVKTIYPKNLLLRSPQETSSRDKNTQYSRELLLQNQILKKTLAECKREVLSAREKVEQLTVEIKSIFNKLDSIKIPDISTKAFLLDPETKDTNRNLVAKKSTAPKPMSRTYQLPYFPIKMLTILKRFESNLCNKEYSQYVFQRIIASNRKLEMDKPAGLLFFLVQSLISIDLLVDFTWDCEQKSQTEPTDVLVVTNFPNFKELFERSANGLARIIFGRNLDKRAIEQFLRSKILFLKKARLEKLQQNKIKLNRTSNESDLNLICAEKTKLIECKPVHDLKEIKWIGEEEVEEAMIEDDIAEEKALEKEPESQNTEEVSQDVEMHNEQTDAVPDEQTDTVHDSADENTDGSNSHNLESILDEHDFEFLDC